jgi:hypothetical protein
VLDVSDNMDFGLAGLGARGRRHTVVEVLVAVSVLALGLLGALSALSLSNRARQDSSDHLAAAAHCEQVMETLLALPYDQLGLQNGASFEIDDMSLGSAPANRIGRVFISDVNGDGGLLEVLVRVDFAGGDGRPSFSASFRTRRAKP